MQAKKKRRNSGTRTVLYTLAIGIWYYRWYILAVLLGAFFTPMAVKAAYAVRGVQGNRRRGSVDSAVRPAGKAGIAG